MLEEDESATRRGRIGQKYKWKLEPVSAKWEMQESLHSYGLVRAEIGQRTRKTSKFQGDITHQNGESLILYISQRCDWENNGRKSFLCSANNTKQPK